MAGDRLLKDMIFYPEAVHHALAAITATTLDFVSYNIDAGVDGFFFATQNAVRTMMSPDQFQEFGAFYDLQVIKSYAKKPGSMLFISMAKTFTSMKSPHIRSMPSTGMTATPGRH